MLKFLKQLFCFHIYEPDLNQRTEEYHCKIVCIKCNKTKEEFM